jgi:hypothetical protein
MRNKRLIYVGDGMIASALLDSSWGARYRHSVLNACVANKLNDIKNSNRKQS